MTFSEYMDKVNRRFQKCNSRKGRLTRVLREDRIVITPRNDLLRPFLNLNTLIIIKRFKQVKLQ